MHYPNDPRFTPARYGHQPQWLLRQALNAACHKRNLDQQSTVRLTRQVMGMFGDPKIEIADLFPHPQHWRIYQGDVKLPIDRQTAQLVLMTIDDYPDAQKALRDYMADIRAALIQ